MTCPEARDHLSALLDDALTESERAPLLAHLAGCAECARERDRLAQTVGLLQAIPPARAPAGFVDRVLAQTERAPWYRRLVRGLVLPLSVKLPVEAAAIVLVAVGVAYVYRSTPELQQADRFATPPSVTVEAPPPSIPASEPPQERQARGADVGRSVELRSRGALEGAREPGPSPPQDTPGAKRQAPLPAPAAADRRLEAKTEERSAAAAPAPPDRELRAQDRVAPPQGRVVAPAPPAAPSRVEKSASGAIAAARGGSVSGRLVVADREAAVLTLADIAGRLGAVSSSPRRGTDAILVEIVVPAARYPELLSELQRVGRFVPDASPDPLPDPVRVLLRLTS